MGKWLESRAWRTGVVFAATLVASGALFAALTGAGQQQSKPASKADLLGLLEAGVSPIQVEKLVRDYGVSFELTPETESDLRKAGATNALIKSVRAAAPKPLGPPVLEIHTTPGRAEVYVDDELRGSTSAEGRLRVTALGAGEHKVRVSLDHYADSEQTARLVAGQTATVTAKLEAAKPPSPPPPPPKAITPKRIRVAGQVEQANLIFQPKPDYPPLARMARIQGAVRLEAVISKDGTIQDLKVITGHPLLAKAALEAVSRWRYRPTLLEGEPVEVVTEIDVNFTLQE